MRGVIGWVTDEEVVVVAEHVELCVKVEESELWTRAKVEFEQQNNAMFTTVWDQWTNAEHTA